MCLRSSWDWNKWLVTDCLQMGYFSPLSSCFSKKKKSRYKSGANAARYRKGLEHVQNLSASKIPSSFCDINRIIVKINYDRKCKLSFNRLQGSVFLLEFHEFQIRKNLRLSVNVVLLYHRSKTDARRSSKNGKKKRKNSGKKQHRTKRQSLRLPSGVGSGKWLTDTERWLWRNTMTL